MSSRVPLLLGLAWGFWSAVGLVVHVPAGTPRLTPTVATEPVAARRWPRWAAWSALSIVVLAVAPPLVLVGPVVAWIRPILRRRRARRSVDGVVRRELPDVVDLLVLAVGSGLTVPLAVAAVARRGQGTVATALGTAIGRVGRGLRLVDALDDIPRDLGDRVRPLVAALVASERYGVPILPALERLAADGRDDRRRHAEAVARRLPVKLLFPLVLCTLPAFALLTVVPLLMGSLRELRL